MSWTLRIAAVLAVLLLAYAIWPVVGFARIASAIEARDGAALAKLVDFHALRKSLTSRSSRPISSGWRTWWASEYGLGDYYVYLPPDKALDKQFKVKLSLKEMQWKLAGIDLPQPMRVELAQQLINQRAEKSE